METEHVTLILYKIPVIVKTVVTQEIMGSTTALIMKGGKGRMRLDRLSITCCLIVLAATWTSVKSDKDKIAFKDDDPDTGSPAKIPAGLPEPRLLGGGGSSGRFAGGSREGKSLLLDWIGLGTGHAVDPYMSRVNEACLNGDFAECFKSRALNSFSDFFDQQQYNVNENVRVIRMPRQVIKEVSRQPYEYSESARSSDSEWDQLVKFALRKAETFIKTAAFEVSVPSWLTGENEVYAPRFVDEIVDEIDVLENKKDTLFSRNRLRRLLIPMLIVLKVFKLKLLLFLPLILGLASFKKFLGFLAIIVPGLIGFFKLCRPLTQSYTPPFYTPSGLGFQPASIYKEGGASPSYGGIYQHYQDSYQPEPPSSSHYGDHHSGGYGGGGQELAYQGYHQDYARSNKKSEQAAEV